ncbi:MAG: hypothetical protein U0O22_01565, partial [Acutalibacteraceae bacterium]
MLRKNNNLVIRVFAVLMVATTILFTFTACSNNTNALPASDIKSADDLADAKIGVQLGTTGDIYAS